MDQESHDYHEESVTPVYTDFKRILSYPKCTQKPPEAVIKGGRHDSKLTIILKTVRSTTSIDRTNRTNKQTFNLGTGA